MPIFDSHAHYDDQRFDADRDALLTRLFQSGEVEAVMTCGDCLESSRRSAALAARYPQVYAAAGVHPQYAEQFDAATLPALRMLVRENPKIRAIGEIGLDYYYDDGAPHALQQQVLRAQIGLAAELGLPVILHDRDAHGDMLAILRETRPAGVVHCYSGSVEMARELLAMGLYLGVTGVVTFPNSRRLREVVQMLPAQRMLIETDAPYLAPAPCRGQRNDSGLLTHVAAQIAQLRGETAAQVIAQTRDNARRLFGLETAG